MNQHNRTAGLKGQIIISRNQPISHHPNRVNDTADVVSDEEMQHMFDQHGLLKDLAHSREHMSGDENTPSAELVISQVVWDEELLQAELFNGMHCTDVIWEEEPHHGTTRNIHFYDENLNDESETIIENSYL